MFTPYCETLILVTHSKSSQINDNGVDLEQFSPDLAGKTGNIMCGLADAVGMIYRKGNQTILSFKSSPNSINEARPLHLRGKEFVVIESDENNNIKVDLEQIFVNN